MNKIPPVISLDPTELATPKLHSYLLSAVAPRPIALASTIDANGNVNLSPFSYFNVFSANPPILIFSPARRATNNTTKHTYENIKEVPEVVINTVNFGIVEQTSLASTEYPEGVNEFKKAGFTEVPSLVVKPPRVAESPVSFECVVNQVIELGSEGGAGNLIICEVKKLHIQTKYLKDDLSLDTQKLDMVARMGENWYTRASKESIFEIPKPLMSKGIGVDQLSQSIRNSNILSANNLGRLGNLDRVPTLEEVQEAKSWQEIRELFLEFETRRDMIKDGIHHLGKKYIEEGETYRALTALMVVDII
jgi:flavin reductase (DIM6/NTAB) family NADH-FMN oxidoreductase RutF